jgi:hypothetical protein
MLNRNKQMHVLTTFCLYYSDNGPCLPKTPSQKSRKEVRKQLRNRNKVLQTFTSISFVTFQLAVSVGINFGGITQSGPDIFDKDNHPTYR